MSYGNNRSCKNAYGDWVSIPNANDIEFTTASSAFYRKTDDKVECKEAIEIAQLVATPFASSFSLPSAYRSADIEESIQIHEEEILVELLLINLINNTIRHDWEKGISQ